MIPARSRDGRLGLILIKAVGACRILDIAARLILRIRWEGTLASVVCLGGTLSAKE